MIFIFLGYHETSRVLDGRFVCHPRDPLRCSQLDFIRKSRQGNFCFLRQTL